MHCCQAGVAWQGDLGSGGCGGRRRLDDFDPGALFPEGCRAPPPVSGTEDDRARCVVVRLELANLTPGPEPGPEPTPNPNPNPNQVRLELGGNNLNGSLSEAWDTEETGLASLAALQYLNLGDQRLVGTLPEGLGHLTALSTLALRANQLSGSIPFELYTLATDHRLRDLDLSANDFDYAASEDLLDSLLPVCQVSSDPDH